MNLMTGGASGTDERLQDASKGKKGCVRHTSHQIQILEQFFKHCPHPDENQRRQLSSTLGLTTRQIKFWFQNKRTQTKNKNERVDTHVLRIENKKIQSENLSIKEELRNALCQCCGGAPFGEEQRRHCLEALQLENACLKEEHAKVSSILAKYTGKQIAKIDSLMPSLRLQSSPLDLLSAGLANQLAGSSIPDNFDLEINDLAGSASAGSILLPYRQRLVGGISDMEKAFMFETATSALDELIRLLRVNEPIWIKSSFDHGRYTLHQESYDKIFPRASCFKSSCVCTESSKDSGIVAMTAMNLVEMLLDPNEWMDLFPTVVTKARLIEVLETGLPVNKSGCLQLMYGQMHVLSPLVPSREFCFLRHCRQIEIGVWVVADVSYDGLKEKVSLSSSWRLPSGCMIQEMPDGNCKVTWIEHVEVDDKTHTHRFYKDLICNGSAYGAERWIVTLQRMCERLDFFNKINAPREGAITQTEGKRNLMKLAHRMVKNFCADLSMSGKMDLPLLSDVNESGVRVSTRNSTEPGQPCGVIISAATSLWLPLDHQTVFSFFLDERKRVQWDVFSSGNLVREIAHISNGTNPGNCISIIHPFIPSENILILQESCTDPLGSMVVYAPIDFPAMSLAMSSEDSLGIPILPSGFVISTDGSSELPTGASAVAKRSAGSLLTVAFQILVSSRFPAPTPKELNKESVENVYTLVSSTVQKIKAALGCSNED